MKKFAAAYALSFALSAAIFVCPALADEGHHEELTTEQLGTVHFSISCSPESQKTFEKGIALLHSFWYEEARKNFRRSFESRSQMRHGVLGTPA